MPHPRRRGLLLAACLPLLLAACGSEAPSLSSAPEAFSATSANGVSLTLASGGGQAGAPGLPLAAPIVVRVTDPKGQPMADRQVIFGPGTNADTDPQTARTDAQGYARTVWTLGPEARSQTLRVSGTGGTLLVTATSKAGKGTRISLVKRQGDEQSAAAGRVLAGMIQAAVFRDNGVLVAGAQVTFTPSSGGKVDRATAPTSSQGIAQVRWTLGPYGGLQTLTATTPGAPPVVYTATATGGMQPRAATLRLAPDSLVLDVGATAQLTAMIRDAGGAQLPGLAPAWTSSNAAVAAVDSVGRVRGVAGGTARITATLGALSASATVRVRGGAATIQLVPDSLVLSVGATGRIAAVLRDASGAVLPGPAPIWSSATPAVAAVDSTGLVRGVKAGTARVTATVGTVSASATVRVSAGPASLRISPDSLVLDVEATGQLSAVLRDASGATLPGPAPTWSSATPAVATVTAQGQVRGVAAGTARITATVGALSASATVRVRPAGGAPTLQLFPDSLVLDIGVWGKLYPVARDASGKAVVGYSLEYTTSSDQVVFPFSDGSLLPIAAGTARVTARWGNATASVLVRVRPPRGGALTIPQIRMAAGYAPRIEATTRDLPTNWWIRVSQRNVTALSMRVRGPSGRIIDCTNSGPESIYRDEFRCDLVIPRGSEPGVWKVDQVTVTKDGRTTTFTAADLEAMGTLGRGFDLFGAGPDTQAPVIRVIWPHQGSRYPDIYYVNLGPLDHVSGLRYARMTVRGPGGVTHTCEVNNSTSGLCRLPLRPGSGTWDIVSVATEDMAGNRATYTPQQIAQLASGMNPAPFLVYSFTP